MFVIGSAFSASGASGTSSITSKTRSAPARAEKKVAICCESMLIGIANCLEY